jgi:hypothetical protein
MGINIYPVRLAGDKVIEAPRWFDSTRYSGDREFISEHSFGWVYSPDRTGSEMPRQRPADFDAAEAWVRAHIKPEGNRARLLALLAYLRDTGDAWIEVST